MKLFLFFISVSYCFDNIVKYINEDSNSTWIAENNEFSKWTLKEIKSILMHDPLTGIANPFSHNVSLPTDFDSRQKWPNSIQPVRNQKQCGSCWAFALTSMLSDRFAVAGCSKGALSPQDLVSCDNSDYGCNGGQFDTSLTWAVNFGVTTEECLPYVSGCGVAPPCPLKCNNKSSIVRYKGKSYNKLQGEEIENAIFSRGSIEVGISVYLDFMFYRTGVYKHKIPLLMGYHAIRCIGWGVDNKHNIPYWLCVNSWGPLWGEKGYFKIIRGKDECNIESNAYEIIVDCKENERKEEYYNNDI